MEEFDQFKITVKPLDFRVNMIIFNKIKQKKSLCYVNDNCWHLRGALNEIFCINYLT